MSTGKRTQKNRPRLRKNRPRLPKYSQLASIAQIRETGLMQCSDCGLFKPVDSFHQAKLARTGRVSTCKACLKNYRKARYLEDLANGKEEELKTRSWHRVREGNLIRLFGMTQDDYDKLLKSQNGLCAICGIASHPEAGKGRGSPRCFPVDHDHQTGKVRAILCHECNKGLGGFKEDPKLMTKAIQYLLTHQAQQPSNPL